jgi:DNA-directed RNA polymerase specialized sigma24 family protein
VVVLHYIQEFSYRQMADLLKEPVGTVKWRTSQAIEKLKKILTDRVVK